MSEIAALETLIRADPAAAGPALDLALRTRHEQGDARAMLALHMMAAEYWRDDLQHVSFHRTHAYVYALEIGDWAAVDRLYGLLSAEGRI